ncbi:family A G protein-coupled receptor-like protein [Daldinia sp. FL1419]|nr:family A G protein-coupled receptor-like protein [Daldinia sp. FL1419]
MGRELTAGELEAISLIERIGSVFSLLGCLFVILTFSLSKAFHKPINRLVFYASFGNMMTNVGTLMSRRYVTELDSFGCQFQGFLIQMFLPADAFWTLAMAFNVYLTFYHKFDAARLRMMEKWYLLICYGIPFVPALTYVFIRTESAGRMYGNATLWCWVSSGWDIFRILTFYGPVWVVILLTMAIYIRAGKDIYQKRKQLRSFGASSSAHDPEALSMNDPYSVKTTEVTVTSESIEESGSGIDLAPLGRFGITKSKPSYSVTISSNNNKGNTKAQENIAPPIPSNVPQTPSAAQSRAKSQKRRANFEANNAAWSYSKCAILFFTALLVTWLPSTANRVYSIVNTNDVLAALEIMSAIVLPLQGFWNCLIYVATSWDSVKMAFSDLRVRVTGRRPELSQYGSDHQDKRNFAFRLGSRNSQKDIETESMTELANSDRASQSNHDIKGQAT